MLDSMKDELDRDFVVVGGTTSGPGTRGSLAASAAASEP
jgi:hypothetical protein